MQQSQRILSRTPLNISLFSLFAALVGCATLYILANHLHHYLLVGAGFFLSLLSLGSLFLFSSTPRSLRRVFASRLLWIPAIFLLAFLDLLRYPVQSHKAHFSTAAPALIEPARSLAHGQDPYLVHLDDGAPISPGPAWIILLAPLTLAGGVMLLTPICMGLCAALISRRSNEGANLFVCFCLLQPVFLSATFMGHDLFAIPIAFAILCLLADRYSQRTGVIALLAIVSAAFATSRLPMVLLLAVLALGLYRKDKRAGLLFLVISLPLSCLWHAIFYLWARHDAAPYQPMHLFTRAGQAGHGMALVGLAAASTVAFWIWFRMRGVAKDWILAGGTFLLAAFVPVGLGELVQSHWRLAKWEGANYVSFSLSLLLVYLALAAGNLGTSTRAREI